jgi:uncharacterized repeat protein (TIGR02543 family)
MKIRITAAILTLLLAAVFASCSGAFLDPGIDVIGLGGGDFGGSGGGSGSGRSKTPAESDYTIGNLNQLVGSVTAVTITANSGKSPGAVKNIRYDGSTTIPQTAGSYYVTFDVEKALGWDAAYDLYAGTLKVNTAYTVTFDINSGIGTTPASQTAGYNSSITLPGGTGFFRSNYEFGGWNTSSYGTGTNYSAGSSYTVNGNITLYAKWNSNASGSEANPISLTEHEWANGSITTNTENREVWYSFNVTAGTTYYVWWNDYYDGNSTKTLDVMVSASYSSGSSIFTNADSAWSTSQSFTAGSSGTVKLRVYPFSSSDTGTFAIVYSTTNSRPTSYTVTFSINDGIGTTPSSQTVSNISSIIILPDGTGFSRDGYEFGGWNTSVTGTGINYSAGSSYTVTNNITLYAKWNPLGSEANPFPLTPDIWTNGIINSRTPNREVWYSFNVIAGATYYVWWNDSAQGDSTKTLDVIVNASYSNGSSIYFADDDSAWTSPQSFTANSTDTIKLRVYTYSSGNGTFAIAYNTGSTKPPPGDGTYANPFPLTSGIWTDGSITASTPNKEVWYFFNVIAGTKYYVWWNDGYSGDGTKTLDVRVNAYYSNDSYIHFTNDDSAWSTPQSFTASSTSTVKLRVYPYSSGSNIGSTFAIVHSASSTRP